MKPTQLSCHSPNRDDHLWVFWSEEAAGDCAIQDQIKIALCSFRTPAFTLHNVMLQFWAPIGRGRSGLLTTCHQPFAHRYMNQELTHYRKHSLAYSGEGEGLVGRVFRNQLPEFSHYYSVKEYPQQRDVTLSCDMSQVLALPVFEPSVQQQPCVGVLELLLSRNLVPLLDYCINMAHTALKKVGLETIVTQELRSQIGKGIDPLDPSDYEDGDIPSSLEQVRSKQFPKDMGSVEGEICKALQQVWRIHSLPFVFAWFRSVDRGGSSNRSYSDSDVSHMGELVFLIPDYIFGYDTCLVSPLGVGQSHIAKAFMFHKSYLCRDVSQLSIINNSRTQFARNSKLTGCFAVYLRSIATGNHDCVLELFLPREEAYSGDLRNFLSSVLTTLKSHLKSFEAVSGALGNESFTEGYKVEGLFVEAYEGKGKNVICTEQSNSAIFSYKTISTSKKSEGERTKTEDSSQSLRTAESTLNSTCRKPVICTGPSYKRSKLDCSPPEIKHVTELDQVMPESSFSVNKIAKIADFDGGFKEGRGKEVVLKKSETEAFETSETASSCYLKLSGNLISEFRTQIPITNECRRGSSCSNEALSEASAVVVRTIPPCTPVPVPDMEMLTMKVIYGEDIIKFPLSSTSSMADLVENIVIRLRMLKDRVFSIEYLDDSGESVLLSSDKDLQDCMDRSRWGVKDMIRMFILLKENVQPLL